MRLATRLCAALLVVGLSAPLASARLYALSYGRTGPDSIEAIAAYSDGGSVVVGTQRSEAAEGEQMWIARLNRVGNPIWQLSVGSEGDETGRAVGVTNSGEILVAGTTTEGTGGLDLLVVRLSGDGSVLAETVVGDAGDEIPRDLLLVDGGAVIVGETTFPAERTAGLALELDATSLAVGWSFTYGAAEHDVDFRALAFRRGAPGGAPPAHLVVGSAGDVASGASDVLVVQLGVDGATILDETLWTLDGRESGRGIARDETLGRTVVVADSVDADQRTRMLVFALDPSFALEWTRLFFFDGSELTGRGIVFSESGDAVVTGTTGRGAGDLAALRLNGSGSVVAERRYGGSFTEDGGHAVIEREDCEGDDGFLFGGITRTFSRGSDDALVVQTDASLRVNSACPYEASLGVLVDVPSLGVSALGLQIDEPSLVASPALPADAVSQSPLEGCRSAPCEVSSSWSTARGGLPLTLRNLDAGEIGCEWMPGPEVAATYFNRYETFVSKLSGGFYGEPIECRIPAEPFLDGAESICADLVVEPGRAQTVLITGGNEWGEGPLGRDSFGNPRPNEAPCP